MRKRDIQDSVPWYEDAFAPLGLGPVAPPPLEPGLPNWTIDLADNTCKVIASTVTDAGGHLATALRDG